MNIYDLDILQKNLDGYDLDQRTFNYGIRSGESAYIVDRSEEMRIDLICNSIYGDTNQVGFLMYYNNIDNPLNIKSGDVIRYVDILSISSFKISADERAKIELLQNLNRGTRTDPNRIDYQKNTPTNPTLNTRPIESVVDRNGVIIIGNRE